MEKKLEVKNLKLSFRTPSGKVQAVRNISFDLYKGETLAIVGESGSGKSVTNRAIMGISAGNAIVESGQIIYDGKDLLRIDEEQFHKIRGDKIAMIFQDPMSSLNPIMRVGRQLTEAMILKGKTSQKNARASFNKMLHLLNHYLKLGTDSPERKAYFDAECHKFDGFCIENTILEQEYNEKVRVAAELDDYLDEFLFLNSKRQNLSEITLAKNVLKSIDGSKHKYVLKDTEELKEITNYFTSLKTENKNDAKVIKEETITKINALRAIIKDAIKESNKPNYFRLGFYLYSEKDASAIENMSIDEMNEFCLKYLDENFMNEFIKNGAEAIALSHNESIEKKKALIAEIDNLIAMVKDENCDMVAFSKQIKAFIKKVEDAIDRLEFNKNNYEYTFRTSVAHGTKEYFRSLKYNPKEQKRFDKQTAKHERLSAKGKKPSWSVIPLSLIDMDEKKNFFVSLLEGLKDNYLRQFEQEYDKTEKMIALIDYFKEQASLVVYRVTKKIAKIKAIKLLEEVGISEPHVRYRQYPFEFSGGMRQRIVIAIALAANPDILICDEPTTALDVTIQSQILELINKLKKERNLSVIFITHDLGVVANMADRVAVMYAGKIVETGTSDEVFYDPRHPYTWALLSSMPDLDTKEKLEAITGTPPNMIYPPVGDAFAARNRYALAIDFEQEPPLFKITDTHYAATWLLHPKAPKINPPKIVTERIARMRKREGLTNGQQ